MSSPLPRRALIIGISEYDHFKPLPGAIVDADNATAALQPLGFQTMSVTGRACLSELSNSAQSFLDTVAQDALSHDAPIAVVIIAGHAVEGEQQFPNLLVSDTQRQAGQETKIFNVCSNIICKLNQIRAKDDGNVISVHVFDCCRQNIENENHTWRASSMLPTLRNDFYSIFSCDPGRRARDSEQGGLIVQELVALLEYAQPITMIFEEAARRAVSKGLVWQRPWVQHRVGSIVPVLGTKRGPFPIPLASTRGFGAFRDANQIDLATLVLAGGTGHGKSTLGNALVEMNVFHASDEEHSQTQHAQHVDTQSDAQSHRIRVIDTAGFLDTSLTPDEHLKRFTEFADLSPMGIDVFIFVMCIAGGRFTAANLDMFEAFCTAVGEEALKHTIVVFTFARGGPVKNAQNPLQYGRDSSNIHLKSMADRVQGLLAIDLDGTSEAQQDARSKILQEVEALIAKNIGEKYSNVVLDSAHYLRQQLEAIVDQLDGDRRSSLQARLDNVHHGREACSKVCEAALQALDAQELEEARRLELERLRRSEEARKAAEDEAKKLAAEEACKVPELSPEEKRQQARQRFNKRAIETHASGRLSKWKWKWDGTARDQMTGIVAQSGGWKSENGAKNHATDELFETLLRNGLV